MFNQQFYPGYMPNSNMYGVQPQAIQQYQSQTPQSICYFVNSVNELGNLRVMPNFYYLGINKDSKEIYVRRMNNDGNIEVETYTLKSEEKQKSENELIAERLSNIETLLKQGGKNGRFNEHANKQPTNE